MEKKKSKGLIFLVIFLATILVPFNFKAKELFSRTAKNGLKEYLSEICQWVESNPVNADNHSSMLMAAGLVRTLLAGFKLAGKKQEYRDTALEWCDLFSSQQHLVKTAKKNIGGLWLNSVNGGNLDLTESNLAAAALACGYKYANKERKKKYLQVLEYYGRFLVEGSLVNPLKTGLVGNKSWVIRKGPNQGAFGTGYVKGKASIKASTASTASGSLFFSQLYKITKNRAYKKQSIEALKWILNNRKATGEIPSFVEGKPLSEKSIKVVYYCAEAFQGAHYLLNDKKIVSWIFTELDPTIRWLLRSQNNKGLWGLDVEERYSSGIVSLLAWFYLNAETDESIPSALEPAWQVWLHPVHSQSFGILMDKIPTGLVGLTIAEMIRPGSTYGRK